MHCFGCRQFEDKHILQKAKLSLG